MEKIKNIPALRFPEFEGIWEKKKLGEVIKFLDGRRKPIKSSDRVKIKGEYPYYGASGIIDFVNDYIFDEEIILLGEDGENIISRNLPLAFKVVGKCWVNNHAHVLKPNMNYQIDFLTQLLENVSYVQYNTGTAQPKLNQEVCRGIPLSFPCYEEQATIASFLTAVDEKLQSLKQKKTLLEQYKKGVMQKIFSQELRFKDDNGNEYADWEEKKLGDVANKKSSNISANKIEDNFGDYILYGASGVLKKVDFFKEEDDYISIVKDGAGVGRLFYCKGKSSVLGTMEIIRPNGGIDTYYLYCLLSNIDFVKYVTGSTIPHIYFKDYSSEICGIPCHQEQTKIANFLSAIDDKINHCQVQIEKTELWKKGLLQQMFC
jgi:type I restriction enzyme S subunit